MLDDSPGQPDVAPAAIQPVVINEALTHTDPPQVDTVELHNPGAAPASVGGWFLSDDHSQPMKYRIPANTIVPAAGYVLFDENQFNNNGSNSFSLFAELVRVPQGKKAPVPFRITPGHHRNSAATAAAPHL